MVNITLLFHISVWEFKKEGEKSDYEFVLKKNCFDENLFDNSKSSKGFSKAKFTIPANT